MLIQSQKQAINTCFFYEVGSFFIEVGEGIIATKVTLKLVLPFPIFINLGFFYIVCLTVHICHGITQLH